MIISQKDAIASLPSVTLLDSKKPRQVTTLSKTFCETTWQPNLESLNKELTLVSYLVGK